MFVNLFLMPHIKYIAFDIKNISRYNNENSKGGLAMNEMEYQMIFKRKSFHFFKDTGHLSDMELTQIEEAFHSCRPLIPEIKVGMKIVPADQTTCKRGQEYCILLYSEKKDGYLPNIGYIGEQLDLYLASVNIGALWFGIGKTEERSDNGLNFVIMIAIAKMPQDKFRKICSKASENLWMKYGMVRITAISVILPGSPPAPAIRSHGSWKQLIQVCLFTDTRSSESGASCLP